MGILDTFSTHEKTVLIVFIIGCPDSMHGTKIGSVNQALRKVSPMLEDHSSIYDFEFKIAVLKYSTGCEWMQNEPKTSSEFQSINLKAGGKAELGSAFLELNNKLSTEQFIKLFRNYAPPVLILFSDCDPTDDYQSGLKKLKENRWYKAALKIAVYIGSDANIEVLKDFTNSWESVIELHNIKKINTLIAGHIKNYDSDSSLPKDSDWGNSNRGKLNNMKKYEQVILRLLI